MSCVISNENYPRPLASRGQSNNYRTLNIQATAYTARCKGCTGITYSGYNVKNTIHYDKLRIIATDHNVIPLYSIVRIETKNSSFHAIVLDKGGGIKNLELDLLVKSYDDAINFGRQTVKVTIIREGRG